MSDEWIVNNCAVLVVVIFILGLGRFLSQQQNIRVTYLIGGILFFSSVVTPLRTAFNGHWDMVTDLPFHLCGISGLICSFLPFLKRKQALFDFVFYTGGLDEVGFDSAAKEGGGSEPRRVAARRYERGGRFASAFFVEESRMTREELEQEKGEGEGGNPLYF